MKILYIGTTDTNSGSLGRAQALERLGHDVVCVDPKTPITRVPHRNAFAVRFSFWPFAPVLHRYLMRETRDIDFDLVWINHGSEVPPSCVANWKKRNIPIIAYNTDDPFGIRDGRKWDFVKRAAPNIDLQVVVREVNIAEAKAHGFRRVKRVFMSYNPVQNKPLPYSEEDEKEWSSKVSFIGNWMPERGPFLEALMDAGIPLAIWGPRWQEYQSQHRLMPCLRGGSIWGEPYVKAIQYSSLCIGLLSKGNRDLHTTRSTEIPYIGSLLFAERTSEHMEMYRDGEEAIFWSDPAECIERCLELLDTPERIKQIRLAGHKRVLELRLKDDDVLQEIINEL